MRIRLFAMSAAFAAGLALLPLSNAQAQYYSPLCNPFPLTWPFCIVGAAATIATAPFVAVAAATAPPVPAPPPPAYYRPYPGPNWRWWRWCRNHPYRCHR